jgi:N-acetylglucosaminyldiphosphoundecaprenol N-acetyl-beta-D-mannosaminyltransferase
MGLPITPVTMRETINLVSQFVNQSDPAFFITANLHYAMLTAEDRTLQSVNREAAFIVADGMPLVWASRKTNQPLPERVTGSDLIFQLTAEAATFGWRVFFLGGRPEIAKRAVDRLKERSPGLTVVGIETPMIRNQSDHQRSEMIQRIRTAKPDLLIGAFSMPDGEKWLARHHREMGVPLSVQLGASIDFAAGHVSRAPEWIQHCGMEWAYRLAVEPRRLANRYARNANFLARQLLLSA